MGLRDTFMNVVSNLLLAVGYSWIFYETFKRGAHLRDWRDRIEQRLTDLEAPGQAALCKSPPEV